MLVPRSAFAARKICDVNSSRFALGAVQFERDADGQPFAVATDGRRLIALTWKEDDAAKYPAVAGCDPAPVANCTMLLPAAICDQAAKSKAGAKAVKPILRNIAIDEHGSDVIAIAATDQNETARIDARQVDGQFPRWRDCVPQVRTDDIHVRLDAKLLRGLLEVIEGHAGGDDCFPVVFSFNRESPAHTAVVLSAENCNGSAVGVIMPRAAQDEIVQPAFTIHRLLDMTPEAETEPEAVESVEVPAEIVPPPAPVAAEPAPVVIAVDLEPAPEAAELPPPPVEFPPKPSKVKPRRVAPQDWRESARAVSLAAFV